MSSTRSQRMERMKEVLQSDQVTVPEALMQLWLLFRFERAITQSARAIHKTHRAQNRANKLMHKLNQNMDIYMFRQEMSKSGI